MASTLPLTGNGSISINTATPADGLIKLTDSTSGAGYTLTIQGSNAASGNFNGGNVVITPGAKTGTGVDGGVGIGVTPDGTKQFTLELTDSATSDTGMHSIYAKHTYLGSTQTNGWHWKAGLLWGDLYVGDSTHSCKGTVHGITSYIHTINNGDPVNDEATPLYLGLTAQTGQRMWAIDLNVQGPWNTAPNLLQGPSFMVNNHSQWAVTNGSCGTVIVTLPNAGPEKGSGDYWHGKRTYPIDAGLAIVGVSGTTDWATIANGFTTALQIGGVAGGWMTSCGMPNAHSKFGTGIDIKDYVNNGIYIHDPQGGGSGYALVTSANAGNVGIGNTTPAEKLDVSGSEIVRGDATAGIRLTSSATVNYIQSDLISGGALTGAADLRFTDTSGAHSWMTITAGGNVGIGTTAPTSMLTVGSIGVNSSSNNYQFGYRYMKTDTSLRRAGTLAQSNEASQPFALYVAVQGATADANRVACLQTGNEGTNNLGNLALQAYGGNVGIGQTSPDTKLHVNGAITLGATGGPQIISGSNTPGAALPNGSIYLRTDSGSHPYLYVMEQGSWVGK